MFWETYTNSVDNKNLPQAKLHLDVSKKKGWAPKMDGENNGKPDFLMDDLGVPLFLDTPKSGSNTLIHIQFSFFTSWGLSLQARDYLSRYRKLPALSLSGGDRNECSSWGGMLSVLFLAGGLWIESQLQVESKLN